MRVLVIGGTRFIGRATVRRLLDRCEVVILHRGQTGPPPMGAREVRGDQRVPGTIAAAVRDVAPDVVLDMCAYFERDGVELVGGLGKSKVVLVSSADVYRNFGGLLGREDGEPDPIPLAETAPLRTRLHPYRSEGCNDFQHEYDKIPIERLVLDAGGSVVRLPMVYGPGDPQRRLTPLLRQMTPDQARIEIPATEARWVSCRAHVEDVAAALTLAVTSPAGSGVYNVAAQQAPTQIEWARSVARAAGWEGEVVEGLDTEESLAFRWPIALDSSRIRQELGYAEVVRFEDGLFETAEWERAHPEPPPPDPRLQRPARPMNRLDSTFSTLRARGEKALVAFVTAGDPSLKDLPAILEAVAEGGADVIEVGLPFSDPIADGPTIQASSQRALDRGVTLDGVLQALAGFDRLPIVLMGYMNPILRVGYGQFAARAAVAGVSGTIVCDLTPDDAEDWLRASQAAGLDTVFLAAPTSTEERLDAVVRAANGFVYAVSRTGVTGAGLESWAPARELVGRVRERTGLPVCVGFGVRTPEDVAAVCEFADGAIVGSALVEMLASDWDSGAGRAKVVEAVRAWKAGTC